MLLVSAIRDSSEAVFALHDDWQLEIVLAAYGPQHGVWKHADAPGLEAPVPEDAEQVRAAVPSEA